MKKYIVLMSLIILTSCSDPWAEPVSTETYLKTLEVHTDKCSNFLDYYKSGMERVDQVNALQVSQDKKDDIFNSVYSTSLVLAGSCVKSLEHRDDISQIKEWTGYQEDWWYSENNIIQNSLNEYLETEKQYHNNTESSQVSLSLSEKNDELYCSLNGKQYPLPENAHCKTLSKTHAWQCDDGFVESWNSCVPGYNTTSCNIKGNVSYNSRTKVYYLPSCGRYNDVEINANYGERWFCSEQEAINAWWIKARTCY